MHQETVSTIKTMQGHKIRSVTTVDGEMNSTTVRFDKVIPDEEVTETMIALGFNVQESDESYGTCVRHVHRFCIIEKEQYKLAVVDDINYC